MSAKLTPEEVLGLACALGFWGKMGGPPPEKVRADFRTTGIEGDALRAAWAAAAHEACSMAAILRAEAQAVVNERKRAAVEPGDGIVTDLYIGPLGHETSRGLAGERKVVAPVRGEPPA